MLSSRAPTASVNSPSDETSMFGDQPLTSSANSSGSGPVSPLTQASSARVKTSP